MAASTSKSNTTAHELPSRSVYGGCCVREVGTYLVVRGASGLGGGGKMLAVVEGRRSAKAQE